MSLKGRTGIFSRYSDKPILISSIFLIVFGSFMIMSAAMPSATGQTSVIVSTGIRQAIYAAVSIFVFFFVSSINVLQVRREVYWLGYGFILFLLLLARIFSAANGAYAWIYLGPVSFQPSEFAKIFIIAFGAKLLGTNQGKVRNLENLKQYAIAAMLYVGIIVVIQHDLGSGVVLFIIAYCIALVPNYKEFRPIQNIMILLIFLGILAVLFILSPIGTSILQKMSGSSYKIARFLSSANPFLYLYDDGYHLVMSLVSFATGGLFGLGYGNSIHKYMNFPNPTTDFILPVVVEELGIVFGLLPVVIAYLGIIIPLRRYSLRCTKNSSKMILFGVYLYFLVHFFLNVGGVSGLIPLTGVPLLLLSAGGTSMMACMASLGLAEAEISRYRKENQ